MGRRKVIWAGALLVQCFLLTEAIYDVHYEMYVTNGILSILSNSFIKGRAKDGTLKVTNKIIKTPKLSRTNKAEKESETIENHEFLAIICKLMAYFNTIPHFNSICQSLRFFLLSPLYPSARLHPIDIHTIFSPEQIKEIFLPLPVPIVSAFYDYHYSNARAPQNKRILHDIFYYALEKLLFANISNLETALANKSDSQTLSIAIGDACSMFLSLNTHAQVAFSINLFSTKDSTENNTIYSMDDIHGLKEYCWNVYQKLFHISSFPLSIVRRVEDANAYFMKKGTPNSPYLLYTALKDFSKRYFAVLSKSFLEKRLHPFNIELSIEKYLAVIEALHLSAFNLALLSSRNGIYLYENFVREGDLNTMIPLTRLKTFINDSAIGKRHKLLTNGKTKVLSRYLNLLQSSLDAFDIENAHLFIWERTQLAGPIERLKLFITTLRRYNLIRSPSLKDFFEVYSDSSPIDLNLQKDNFLNIHLLGGFAREVIAFTQRVQDMELEGRIYVGGKLTPAISLSAKGGFFPNLKQWERYENSSTVMNMSWLNDNSPLERIYRFTSHYYSKGPQPESIIRSYNFDGVYKKYLALYDVSRNNKPERQWNLSLLPHIVKYFQRNIRYSANPKELTMRSNFFPVLNKDAPVLDESLVLVQRRNYLEKEDYYWRTVNDYTINDKKTYGYISHNGLIRLSVIDESKMNAPIGQTSRFVSGADMKKERKTFIDFLLDLRPKRKNTARTEQLILAHQRRLMNVNPEHAYSLNYIQSNYRSHMKLMQRTILLLMKKAIEGNELLQEYESGFKNIWNSSDNRKIFNDEDDIDLLLAENKKVKEEPLEQAFLMTGYDLIDSKPKFGENWSLIDSPDFGIVNEIEGTESELEKAFMDAAVLWKEERGDVGESQKVLEIESFGESQVELGEDLESLSEEQSAPYSDYNPEDDSPGEDSD